MERLTIRMPDGTIKLVKDTEVMCFGDAQKNLQQVIKRLADYEDLGITAEQIRDIDEAYTELCVKHGEYTKIGTAEEFREAVEKEPCKAHRVLLYNGKTGYECGYCGNELKINEFYGDYCHWCGNALNWKE